MIPHTATRVPKHTVPHVNARIREEPLERLRALEANDRNALIGQRLRELDREWDVERALQTNFRIAPGIMRAMRGS